MLEVQTEHAIPTLILLAGLVQRQQSEATHHPCTAHHHVDCNDPDRFSAGQVEECAICRQIGPEPGSVHVIVLFVGPHCEGVVRMGI